jgi:putative inorganic carbon (hco3(-)) transporter
MRLIPNMLFVLRALAISGAIILLYVLIIIAPYSYYTLTAVFLLCFGVALAFTDANPFLGLLFFLMPFSIDMPFGFGDSKILFPTEVVILTLGIAFFLKIFLKKNLLKDFIKNPVSSIVILYILVLIITTITSQMPVVSIKFSLVNIFYIVVFYFFTRLYLNNSPERSFRLYSYYGAALFVVVIYALSIHASYGFTKDEASFSVKPFYSDHAIYSACLAMVVPAFIAFSLKGKVLGLTYLYRIISIIILLVFIVGIFFSYSRASWLSLAVCCGFYLLLRLKIKPLQVIGLILVGCIIILIGKNDIISSFKMNHYNSSKGNVSLEDETKSITNIRSDISNAERLNRWSCAYRMFLDKPLTGYGPGTYQFKYLSYQRHNEMTSISVVTAYNNPLGKGGSAHSEYLLALAESGIFGFLCMVLIVLVSVWQGMKSYAFASTEKEKIIIAVALFAMLSYGIHVIFNNYLNIDKTAGLFWASVSILASVSEKQKSGNQRMWN